MYTLRCRRAANNSNVISTHRCLAFAVSFIASCAYVDHLWNSCAGWSEIAIVYNSSHPNALANNDNYRCLNSASMLQPSSWQPMSTSNDTTVLPFQPFCEDHQQETGGAWRVLDCDQVAAPAEQQVCPSCTPDVESLPLSSLMENDQ
eukprot:385340-Amphidinium_carterae.1